MEPTAGLDAASALRRRKQLRLALIVGIAVLGLVVALEWLGLFGWRGDDHRRYETKTFPVAGIIDGQTVLLRESDGRLTPVRLMGIDAPSESAPALKAAQAILEMTWKKSVLVHFDQMGTRDDDGQLTAYLYLDDSDMLNTDLVKAGAVRAIRSMRCDMTTTFTLAEADARKHKRGIWEKDNPTSKPATRKN